MPDAAGRDHTGWTEAEQRLDDARKLLRRGEARDALGSVLDAFESVISGPYDAKQWNAKLRSLPEEALPQQKREGLADMLAGFCTYLNRVGHHRGRKADAASAMLPAMPVDQWEAEHVIAAAHFLLSLALRVVEKAPATTVAAAAPVATSP